MLEPKHDPLPGGLSSPTECTISAPKPEIYEECITCKDLGYFCKGPKLNSLVTISNVREYHRRLRIFRKFTVHQIYILVSDAISEGSVKDYFGHEEKDFRWTTVALIDNAMVALCGDGTIPTVPLCPATASCYQSQIEAEISMRKQAEEQCAALQAQMAELAEKHLDQVAQFQASSQERVDWLKDDIRLWRRFSFSLLAVLFIALTALLLFHISPGLLG